MTRGATGGPASPCGTPLLRVSHGRYRLADTQSEPAPPNRAAPAPAPARPAVAAAPPHDAADLILVGCVKTKADHPQAARDLYRSPLFLRRRHYAEQHTARWYILSAEHGLVAPHALLEPYDTALAEQSEEYRRAWGLWVAAKLRRLEGDLRGRVIEIHAGDAYVAPLRQTLSAAGAVVRHPVAGLRQGEQLSWYDRPTPVFFSEAATSPADDEAGNPSGQEHDWPDVSFADLTLLEGPNRTPAFVYRWPDQTESFDTGWNLVVSERGRRYPVKIGLSLRFAYGHNRRRLVIWVSGQPVAEAVAEDDYATSRHLVGLLKDAEGRMVRPDETPPPAYSGFPLVHFPDVVSGPSTRNGIAARLPEDDIIGWTAFALARTAARAAGRTVPDDTAAIPQPPAPRRPTDTNRQAVVAAILQYGRDHRQDYVGRPPQFTPHAEANQLILDDPFAFLLAVILDQGIPAERAWRGPYDLQLRLGHLDPARIASQPEQVAAAVAQSPALHRFINRMPAWLVAAGSKVINEYHGDAGKIWSGNPRAADLAARLSTFAGISQKKSAMAVEILARDMGEPIRDLTGSDIAYDVHVRRVFLRTRLAERDDLDHMVQVARQLHSQRPGELDFPTWLIGRRWCGPGSPDCTSCVLNPVCPKDINRASGISGS
jgi:uncharacterized HhH-GPD family protein